MLHSAIMKLICHYSAHSQTSSQSRMSFEGEKSQFKVGSEVFDCPKERKCCSQLSEGRELLVKQVCCKQTLKQLF